MDSPREGTTAGINQLLDVNRRVQKLEERGTELITINYFNNLNAPSQS